MDSRPEDLTRFGELLPTATQAMDIAVEIIRDHLPAVIRAKGDRDMVSDIDVQIERAVRGFLRGPDAATSGSWGRRRGALAGRAAVGPRSDRRNCELRQRDPAVRNLPGPGQR